MPIKKAIETEIITAGKSLTDPKTIFYKFKGEFDIWKL